MTLLAITGSISAYANLYAMHIRFGTHDDAKRIAELHTRSWQTAYSGIMPAGYLNGSLLDERKAAWNTRLAAVTPESDHASCLLVAAEGTALVGFVYLTLESDGRLLLDNLHVEPGHKRSGIGRQLVHRAFSWAATHHPGRVVYLEVLRDNVPAIAFYERLGGRPTKEFVERFTMGFELPVIEYTWTQDLVGTLALLASETPPAGASAAG
ncbi:GNAT family N-acetyltransferase [Microtetraspora niveoalba]|uniref:GNAT family N-acetyltransferase n=1 Tax=Microtetraspora niveoalba TaxID=46175 RepID=UPI000B2289B9|nr:GNAT family N-acetyltransferase [Microtetraspora niveoalba]